jgi:uncharacterized protein
MRLRPISLVLVFLLLPGALFAADMPDYVGYVNDFAGVIDASDEQEITDLARSLEQNGGIQIAVVTVEQMGGESIEMYANRLANSWGIGSSEDDSGLLLLLAMQERQVRFEIGYGLEGDLPDGLVGRILDDYVLPPFREGDYSRGLKEGAFASAAVLARQREFSLDGIDENQYSVEDDPASEILSIIVVLFVIFGIMTRSRLWPLLFLMGGGHHPRHRGGGGFGSFSGGGGFGGFGGGGFGGGGASRGF